MPHPERGLKAFDQRPNAVVTSEKIEATARNTLSERVSSSSNRKRTAAGG
jgi:hypothetical protein